MKDIICAGLLNNVNHDKRLMKDVIRVGFVSSINYEKGFVQVTYPDRENAVSGELPYFSDYYQMPEVGDRVVVLYLTNGNHEGFVLGKYYHDENMPVKSGKGLLHKPLHQNGAEIRYEQNSDAFYLKAGQIQVDGNTVNVNGDNITLFANSLALSGGKSSIETDGNAIKIKAGNAIIEADSIVLNSANITLNGTNITLKGDTITLQGKTDKKVIA